MMQYYVLIVNMQLQSVILTIQLKQDGLQIGTQARDINTTSSVSKTSTVQSQAVKEGFKGVGGLFAIENLSMSSRREGWQQNLTNFQQS